MFFPHLFPCFYIIKMDNSERILGLHSTISRLSHHCFQLCDKDGKPFQTPSESKCIKACVEFSLKNRNLTLERMNKEYPESVKLNKSLEFKTFFEFT